MDDNTRMPWQPVTGGANVPAINDFLVPAFGMALGGAVLEGVFSLPGGEVNFFFLKILFIIFFALSFFFFFVFSCHFFCVFSGGFLLIFVFSFFLFFAQVFCLLSVSFLLDFFAYLLLRF